MLNDLIKVKDQVAYVLEKHPLTRDDDKLAWLAHLVYFCNLRNSLGSDAYDRFRLVLMHEATPTMESVTRARRAIQEDRVHLRGEKYYERHKEYDKMHDHFAESLRDDHAEENGYERD